MERLTVWHDGYHGVCEKIGCANHCTEDCIIVAEEDCGTLVNIIDRLAAYEDTGLEPQEIEAIIKENLRLKRDLKQSYDACALAAAANMEG
jgi:hypothetical protein